MQPVNIPRLRLLGADIDAHIRDINKSLPGSITVIGSYLSTLDVLESSHNVYLSQIKKALRLTLGDTYHFKSGVRYSIDTYFAGLRKKVPDSDKSRKIPWDDIATFMVRGGIRTSGLIEIFCRTGLRVSELCNAKWDHLKRANNGFELFVLGKGRKKRWIAFPADLVARIKKVFRGRTHLIETNSHKQYNRKEVYFLFSKGARRHLGYSFGPHALRHTFASDVYENWPNLLKALARHLGHKSVDMTMKYIHQNLQLHNLPAMPQQSLFDSNTQKGKKTA